MLLLEPILWMRKWQHREVKQLDQGYPPHETQNWERDGVLTPEPAPFINLLPTYQPSQRKSEN